MRLTRREVLVSGLATTAGCIGSSGPTNPSPTAPSPSPTATRTQSPDQIGNRTDSSGDGTPGPEQTLDTPRSVSLVSVIQQEGSDTLAAEATLRENTITTEHPPTLRVTITADTETTVTYEDCPPGDLHHAHSTASDNHLYVSEYDTDKETRACWHLPYTALNMGRPCFEETVTITPETPFSRTFTIWDDRENPSCYPLGEYRVDVSVTIDDSENATYKWSVFLQITA